MVIREGSVIIIGLILTIKKDKRLGTVMKRIGKQEIKNLVYQHKELIKKYNIKKIGLFGSYVRNQQNKSSDIDFLVEFKPAISLLKHVKLQNDLADIFKKKVEVVSAKAVKARLKPHIMKEVEWFERL